MKILTHYQRKQAALTRAMLKAFQNYCRAYGIADDEESILIFKLIHKAGVADGRADLSTKDIFGEGAA